MTTPIDHDAYMAAVAKPLRPLLIQLRAQLAKKLPDVEEITARLTLASRKKSDL